MNDSRFDLLLDAYLEGEMVPTDEAELHQLLQGDAGLRKQFAHRLLLETQLRKAFAAPMAPTLPLPAAPKSRKVAFRWAAAAAVVFGVGLAAWGTLHGLTSHAVAGFEDLRAEDNLLERINKERSKFRFEAQGRKLPVPELRENQALQRVAQDHARELSCKRVKSFMEADMNRELEEAGYQAQYWALVPGVAAVPQPEAASSGRRSRLARSREAEAFESWLDAKNQQPVSGLPHPRQVLLNPYMEDAGIGVYRDSKSGVYYAFILLAKKKMGAPGGNAQPADEGRAVRRAREYQRATIQPFFLQGVSS